MASSDSSGLGGGRHEGLPPLSMRELSNYEAVTFLKAKKAARDARPQIDPALLNIATSSSFSPSAVAAAQSANALDARLKAAKWVERKAIHYLAHQTPAAGQSVEQITAALEALRDDGNDVGRGLGLRRAQKMALINLRASTALQVIIAVEPLPIDTDTAERIATRLAEIMPEAPKHVSTDARDMRNNAASGSGGVPGDASGGGDHQQQAAAGGRNRSNSSSSSSSANGGRGRRRRARAGSATSASSSASTASGSKSATGNTAAAASGGGGGGGATDVSGKVGVKRPRGASTSGGEAAGGQSSKGALADSSSSSSTAAAAPDSSAAAVDRGNAGSSSGAPAAADSSSSSTGCGGKAAGGKRGAKGGPR